MRMNGNSVLFQKTIRVAIITLHIILTSCNTQKQTTPTTPPPQTAAILSALPQASVAIEPQTIGLLKAAPSSSNTYATDFVWLPDSTNIMLATGQGISRHAVSQNVLVPHAQAAGAGEAITATNPTLITTAQSQNALAWIDGEQSVIYWDLSTTNQPEMLIDQAAPVTGLAISPAGDQLAFAISTDELTLWDTSDKKPRLQIQTTTWLANLSYSPDGSLIAGADLADFKAYIFDAKTGQTLRTLEWIDGSPGKLYGAYFSPDWSFIAWVAQSAVQLMDISSGKPGKLLSHQDFISALAWSPDGQLVSTASAAIADDGQFKPAVLLWEAASGQLLRTLYQEAPVQSLSFSPDGSKLAVLDSNGQIRLWQIGR